MIKKCRSCRGQAIVELAFVLPLILIFILGIIEFGIIFYNKAMVTNASREGARAGMTYQADSGTYWTVPEMEAAVRAAVTRYLQAKLITFGGTPIWVTDPIIRTGHSPGDPDWPTFNVIGGTVDVTVTYTHTFLAFPRIAGLGNNIDLDARTIMRLE